MRNQTSFRLTTTLLPTDLTAKTTQVINKVDSDGNKFYPSFTEETVVLTNDDRTIMETTRATASNGVLTFTKRGLSDDDSETQVANRKLTWNPGTLAFITAGAGDWIDKDDNVEWTGKQTYTGELVSTNKATYKGQLITEKGVKYPSFADVAALEAYTDPFGGMFATVDSTGELYRYNANTCSWDLVSTAALGTYTFVCCSSAPSGAEDTVITMTPNSSKIYIGDTELVGSPKFADVLLVAGGGGGSLYGPGAGGGGVFLGEKVGLGNKSSFCVCVGAAGSSGVDGCPTSMEAISSVTGGQAKPISDYGINGFQSGTSGLNKKRYNGGAGCTYGCTSYGGGGGARGNGGNSYSSSNYSYDYGGSGGEGIISDISGEVAYYGFGGAGSAYPCGTQGTTCIGCGVGGGRQGSAQPGIAIVRYPTDGAYGIHCATGGTVTTCGGYTIHTFTCDGTFTIVN